MNKSLKIGNQIFEKRKALNLSTSEVADNLGISEECYVEIEKGNKSIPLEQYEDVLIYLVNLSLKQYRFNH